MKKILSLFLTVLMLMVSLIGCMKSNAFEATYEFKGVIKEVSNNTALVAINEDEELFKSSGDLVKVYLGEGGIDISAGDEITIEYDGNVMESDPLQVKALSIKIKDEVIEVEKSSKSTTNPDDAVGITSDGEEFIIQSKVTDQGDTVTDVEETTPTKPVAKQDVNGESSNTEIVPLSQQEETDGEKLVFIGEVTEVLDGSYIIVPNADEDIRSSGDKVIIYTNEEYSEGDKLKITYKSIMESYPLQVDDIEIERLK